MTAQLGNELELADSRVLARAVERFREAGIALPTFAQLADPALIDRFRLTPLAVGEHRSPEAGESMLALQPSWRIPSA